jgi:hypothetical protein
VGREKVSCSVDLASRVKFAGFYGTPDLEETVRHLMCVQAFPEWWEQILDSKLSEAVARTSETTRGE